MKKYSALVFSLSALIINFICSWYSDVLIDRLFVFAIIPLAVSVLILLAGLILSVVLIGRRPSEIKYYFPVLISFITIVVLFVFPFRTARVNLELQLYDKVRTQIIEMVKRREITADKLGNAELPSEFSQTSSDGHVFIYQNDEEQVISFWVFRGLLSGSIQLIYSSLDESLIYENETGHPIIGVEKLKEHWYLVETDY